MRFETRGILVHPEDLTLSWLDRMRAVNLNALGLHPVGGAEARTSLQRAIDAHNAPESVRLRAEAAARGISVDYETHTMAWLLPRETFACKPEWFRMNEKGERTNDFNLCVSNRDALDYVAERAARLADLLDTGARKRYYWLDDVTNGACQCPDCRRLSASDQQLTVVNAMLSGLKKRDPDAKLCYIAYHGAMDAPRRVEPANGVFLEYAPINRDYHKPLSDATSPENAREIRAIRDLLACFGKKDAKALDYWMDNSLFSGYKRPPKRFTLDEDVLRRDADFYDALGFQSVTSFGCFLGPDYASRYDEPPLQAYGDILAGI